jgi:hypothetical protein
MRFEVLVETHTISVHREMMTSRLELRFLVSISEIDRQLSSFFLESYLFRASLHPTFIKLYH